MYIKRDIGIRRSADVRRREAFNFINKIKDFIKEERAVVLSYPYVTRLKFRWSKLVGVYLNGLLRHLEYSQIAPVHRFMCRLIDYLLGDIGSSPVDFRSLIKFRQSFGDFGKRHGFNRKEMDRFRRLL